jgi:hypothetical protein
MLPPEIQDRTIRLLARLLRLQAERTAVFDETREGCHE